MRALRCAQAVSINCQAHSRAFSEIRAPAIGMKSPAPKLICIVGVTGVGKSKLGIELARKLNGEIINADAVQMYKGLDIATAKITDEESEGVKHHLLSVLNPQDNTFTVQSFRDRALPLIHDIHQRGKQPIVVGGTLYYIQSLLWPSLIDEVATSDNANEAEEEAAATSIEDKIYSYERLVTVDPEMAAQLHPNDTRKIERSIKIFEDTGMQHSKLIAKQKKEGLEQNRRFDSLLLWPSCEQGVHRERLSKRVDKMMKAGLLKEASDFVKDLRQAHPEGDVFVHSGIFQAIGYKEFLPYIDADAKEGEANEEVLQKCVERLNIHHRQYAKRQLQWIKNRILSRNVPVFELDTTNASLWDVNVHKPALELCNLFLSSESWGTVKKISVQGAILKNTKGNESGRHKQKRYVCDVCDGKILFGNLQREIHLGSRAHRKRVKRSKNQSSSTWKRSKTDTVIVDR